MIRKREQKIVREMLKKHEEKQRMAEEKRETEKMKALHKVLELREKQEMK